MEIEYQVIINWAAVTAATVVLAFIVNQGFKLINVQLEEKHKKIVAFIFSVGAAAVFAIGSLPALPDPGEDPVQFAIVFLSVVVGIFKAAQQIYDYAWKKLVEA